MQAFSKTHMMKVSSMNFISEGLSADNYFNSCFSNLAAWTWTGLLFCSVCQLPGGLIVLPVSVWPALLPEQPRQGLHSGLVRHVLSFCKSDGIHSCPSCEGQEELPRPLNIIYTDKV